MPNPFQPYYDSFNAGSGAGKLGNLRDFPRMLDLEVTSACNFRCLMCPTGNLSLTRPAGFMDPETFRQIVRQCAPHGTALRFIGWGEPLLHPRIAEFVAEAVSAGLLTHLNTNSSKLDYRMAAALLDAGLHSLKFSFQGVDRASYRAMRNVDWFDQLCERIEMVGAIRAGRLRPWLHVSTTVTDESGERIEAFRARFAPLVDQVSVGNTVFDFFDVTAVRLDDADRRRLEELKALSSADKRHPDPCPEVYDKLSIHHDGSVRVCCNDYNGETDLGNVNTTSLRNIWMHPTIREYRERLARREYTGPLCGQCFDYMSLTGQEPG